MEEAPNGRPTVCSFVIEVISKNDQASNLEKKLGEYFADGVQVIWVVFPQVKKVEVWRSIRDVTICFDDDVCSAAPTLPDMEMTAKEILG